MIFKLYLERCSKILLIGGFYFLRGKQLDNPGREKRIYQTTAADMNIYNMFGKWQVVDY